MSFYRSNITLLLSNHVKEPPGTRPNFSNNRLLTRSILLNSSMPADSEILTQLTEAVSKLADNALSTTGIQAVAVKLPEFWIDDPEIWFLRAEAQFRSKSIIVDQTKFDYVITALDNRAAAEVKAVLLNPPEQGKYNALKTALLNAFGKSQLQKDAELLNISGLRILTLFRQDALRILTLSRVSQQSRRHPSVSIFFSTTSVAGSRDSSGSKISKSTRVSFSCRIIELYM